MRCDACGSDEAGSGRFCARCGQPLVPACAGCGAAMPAGARYCPSCGRAVAPVEGREERKLVSVLFADLVDSTMFTERLDAERLRAALGAYFSAVSSTVTAWGGSVEKYLGDAVVAVFGMPRVREDDAARAVSAAAEIIDRVRALDDDQGSRLGVRFGVRVGVTTGEAIIENDPREHQPRMTGEASTLAARLQALAEPGSVLVGERTAALAGPGFTFGDPIPLQVKGRTEPIVARGLLARVPGAGTTARGRSFGAPMVGRDRELAVMAGLLDDVVAARRPRLVLVSGTAGMGKSRLVRELVATAASERPDLLVVRGRCPSAGPGVTLWALADVVRATCGISLDDPATRATTLLRETVTRVMRQSGDPADPDPTLFALATTAGIGVLGNPNADLRPGFVARELNIHWPRFMSALAASRPVLLVIEDVHWASDTLLDILDKIVTRASGPLLVVTTARPDEGEAPASLARLREAATVVPVHPLGDQEARRLVGRLLGDADDLPRDVVDDVIDGAGGNPLFLEEVLAELADSGALTKDPEGWRLARRSDGLAIPDTIQGVLGARIDGLDRDEKSVIEAAAVVGRVFWPGAVESEQEQELMTVLDRLERRGLVALRPTSTIGGELEYAFKHALLRDVAYAGLSRRRRSRMHAAVAMWLGTIASDHPDELAELVAYHWSASMEDAGAGWEGDQAGLAMVREGAFEGLVRGGAVARQRWATARAITYHEAALALATTDAERARADEELGDDHDAAYHGDDALPRWRRALEASLASGAEPEVVARLCFKAASMGAIRWGGFRQPMDPAEIDRLVDHGLAAIEGMPSPTRPRLLAARAATASRWAAFHLPDPVPTEERALAASTAFAAARASGDAWLASMAMRALVALRMITGDAPASIEASRRAAAIADDIESMGLRHIYAFMATIALVWNAGEAEVQLPRVEELLRVAHDLDTHEVLHSTCARISALGQLGRWDEAMEAIEEHEQQFTLEADMACPYVRGGLPAAAAILARRGATERARALLGRLPTGDWPVGLVEGLTALALARLDDPVAARDLATATIATGRRNFAEEPPFELLALLEAQEALGDDDGLRGTLAVIAGRVDEMALLGPSIDLAEGRIAMRAGDASRSAELLTRAVEGFDRLGAAWEAARAREALAAVEPGRAEDLLATARASYQRMGAQLDLARIAI